MISLQIGRLEIYFNPTWDVSYTKALCDCYILDLGFIGFTWLSKDCSEF